MKAVVLISPQPIANHPLRIEDVSPPAPDPGHVLLRVLACGVCRTDLHIVEGELPPLHPRIIPGHQIVGEIVEVGNAHVGADALVRPVERSSTPARTAGVAKRTFATRQPLPATQSTEATPNTRWLAPILSFQSPPPSMISTPLRSCAP